MYFKINIHNVIFSCTNHLGTLIAPEVYPKSYRDVQSCPSGRPTNEAFWASQKKSTQQLQSSPNHEVQISAAFFSKYPDQSTTILVLISLLLFSTLICLYNCLKFWSPTEISRAGRSKIILFRGGFLFVLELWL